MEPISHFFHSGQLKLQFWDYGGDDKPVVVLVHGGLDHARSWDWTARALRDAYHVYSYDLRGHGNSAHVPGAMYSLAEHVRDLASLVDIVAPAGATANVRLIGHSLGGMIVLHYAGLFPERVSHAVSVEGIGFALGHRLLGPAPERLRHWIDSVRQAETRTPKPYPHLDAAVARMKEANPRLSDDVARHLTLHGTNWNSDGSMTWKFDNQLRTVSPYGHNLEDAAQVHGRIACPVLFFWGLKSFAPVPTGDPRFDAIRDKRMVIAPEAGHWVHHDELDLFLGETVRFLASVPDPR